MFSYSDVSFGKAIANISVGLIRSEMIVMQNRATPFSGDNCALHFTLVPDFVE